MKRGKTDGELLYEKWKSLTDSNRRGSTWGWLADDSRGAWERLAEYIEEQKEIEYDKGFSHGYDSNEDE